MSSSSMVEQSRMRVLLLGPLPPEIGGVASHVRDLALALNARGHPITVLARESQSQDRNSGDEFDGTDIRVVRLSDQWLSRAGWLFAIRREAARHDVVHAHSFRLAYLVSRVVPSRVPLVVTLHGYLAAEMLSGNRRLIPMWLYEQVERGGLGRANAIVAVDRDHEEWARRVHNLAVDLVMPNCLWLDDYPQSTTNFSSRRLDLVSARRLDTRYGLEFAIRAMPLLQDLDLKLRIIGDGPLRGQLEQLSRALGVSDRVLFSGHLRRELTVESMGRSLATIIPSIVWRGDQEGTPVAALESMAVGTPVIASRSGGLAEIITDGETGFLVKPGDPQAIADQVRLLAAHEGIWNTMANRAREYVVREHDWSKAVILMEEIYLSAIQKCGR